MNSGESSLRTVLGNIDPFKIDALQIVIAGEERRDLLLGDHAELAEFGDDGVARVFLPRLKQEILLLRDQVVIQQKMWERGNSCVKPAFPFGNTTWQLQESTICNFAKRIPRELGVLQICKCRRPERHV